MWKELEVPYYLDSFDVCLYHVKEDGHTNWSLISSGLGQGHQNKSCFSVWFTFLWLSFLRFLFLKLPNFLASSMYFEMVILVTHLIIFMVETIHHLAGNGSFVHYFCLFVSVLKYRWKENENKERYFLIQKLFFSGEVKNSASHYWWAKSTLWKKLKSNETEW